MLYIKYILDDNDHGLISQYKILNLIKNICVTKSKQ